MVVAALLEERPWRAKRGTDKAEMRFESGHWIAPGPAAAHRLPKVEAQLWLALLNLSTDPAVRARYAFTGARVYSRLWPTDSECRRVCVLGAAWSAWYRLPHACRPASLTSPPLAPTFRKRAPPHMRAQCDARATCPMRFMHAPTLPWQTTARPR